MAGLPGASLPSQQQKPSKTAGKKQKSKKDDEEGKMEELSFEEIRVLEQELLALTQGKVKSELAAVRKKREEDELLGRKKPVEKISLSELETAFTGKQGGLPEHIANLPENHPLRVRWEQGFRRRPDGTWYKTGSSELSSRRQKETTPAVVVFSYWIVVLIIAVTMLASIKMYNKALEKKRAEIIKVVKNKGLALKDPVIQAKYKMILVTNWLPDLDRLLLDIHKIPRNFDAFPDNPEQGSYVDYIKRHDLPFNEKDAQEWYTRSIRKPVR